MLYNIETKDIIFNKQTNAFETDDFNVFWEGFLYIKGFEPGAESVNRLLEELKNFPITIACNLLSGTFSCIIKEVKNNIFYFFSDNNGIYNFFHSNTVISTSLLDSIRENKLNKSNINAINIVDFVITQSLMGCKTFFDAIKKIKYDEIIIDYGKTLKFEKKSFEDIFSIKKCEKTIIDKFAPISKSLKKYRGKICIDLTAGLDTRMITSIFHFYKLNFDTAISGSPNCTDIEFSKKISNILGTNHNINYHDVNANRLKNELNDGFHYFDASTDIIAWNRLYQHQKSLIQKGYNLSITGMGGELYKPEFCWFLDNRDPFKAIEQLTNKITSIRYGLKTDTIPHHIFTKGYKTYSISYKNRVRNYLNRTYGNCKSRNIGARIYFTFMECSRLTDLSSNLDRYDILFDRDIIPCGTTLYNQKLPFIGTLTEKFRKPWGGRKLFERKVITYLNNKVGKVRINWADNASSQTYDLIKAYLRKIVKKFQFGRREVIPPNNSELYPTARSLDVTEEMIEILKNEKIIRKNVSIDEINDIYLGTLFTLGKLFDFCETIS